ncbi:MAG: hypothetical protein FJ128_08110 [Deltaproteobacteria bacterium]|nr:hypothetical protein [Deltaproteobacteria bacterium]
MIVRLIAGVGLLCALMAGNFCTADASQEDALILKAARAYVIANSAQGIRFSLKIIKKKDNLALLKVIPRQKDLDEAAVIMEKVGGAWVGRDLGTDPDLEKYPQLLKE